VHLFPLPAGLVCVLLFLLVPRAEARDEDGEALMHLRQATCSRARTLFQEGDEHYDDFRDEQAIACWTEAYLLMIPCWRDLPFLGPVKRASIPREALEPRMRSLLDEEFDADALAYECMYAHMGFAEEGSNVAELFVPLLAEEIAGYYDTEEKTFFVVDDEEYPFDPNELKVVICHELAHALADQHFDLDALDRRSEHDDDMLLAISALGEGEADLVASMDDEAQTPFGYREALRGDGLAWAAFDVGLDLLDALIASLYLPALAALDLLAPLPEVGASAPLVLLEESTFPYEKGLLFCRFLTRTGGWEAVNSAFADPPLSTEQILHPGKYRGPGRDDPTEILLGEDEPPLLARSELLLENVLGEHHLEVLLRPRLGVLRSTDAARGWDGDLYRLYRRASGETVFLFCSIWDTEADAREFATALLEMRRPEGAAAVDLPPSRGEGAAWSRGVLVSAIVWHGDRVVFVDHSPKNDLGEILDHCLGATTREKKLAPADVAEEEEDE